jgi:nicotinamidase-related amidase
VYTLYLLRYLCGTFLPSDRQLTTGNWQPGRARPLEPRGASPRFSAMPRTATLHGAAPDEHPTALLIIDLISDFAFEDGRTLVLAAKRIVKPIAKLSARARSAGVPVIYVNDNRGRWRSDRSELIARCLRPDSMGRPIVQQLAPEPRDYFIFKPKHSGFFATPLAALLEHLGSRTLILTGLTLEQCVMFTAIDAYVREFELLVPRDCVAGLQLRAGSLNHIKRILKAKATQSPRIVLAKSRSERRTKQRD